MNQGIDPAASPGAAKQFFSVAAARRLAAIDEVETQRRVIWFMLWFRREIALAFKQYTRAASAHRFNHAAAVNAQEQERSDESKNGGNDNDERQLSSKRDGESL